MRLLVTGSMRLFKNMRLISMVHLLTRLYGRCCVELINQQYVGRAGSGNKSHTALVGMV